jgi:hypothetical protein
MDVIDLEDEQIDAEVLNSMAVTQVSHESKRSCQWCRSMPIIFGHAKRPVLVDNGA